MFKAKQLFHSEVSYEILRIENFSYFYNIVVNKNNYD